VAGRPVADLLSAIRRRAYDEIGITDGMERRRFIKEAAALGLTAWGRTAHAVPPPRAAGASPGGTLDVTRFGAVADGRTLCTAAIQRAIDECAGAGGGTVVIPPGRYLSGTINLRSHVNLQILSGATLVASQRFDDFPAMPGRHEGIERTVHGALLVGVDLVDVTIGGTGTLDGQGQPWWLAADITMKMRADLKLPREAESPPGAPLKWPRPRMVNFIRCRGVVVEGLTVKDSPSWNLHFVYCEDVAVTRVTLLGKDARGTDGVVVDSSKRVRISSCVLGSGADCVSIKSGYNEEGRRIGLPSEDIVVTACNMFYSYSSGVAIGSETSGGIHDVLVSDCVMRNCRTGVSVRSPRGRGGVVERIRVTGVTMDQISEMAIKVSNYYDSVRMEGRLGWRIQLGRRNLEIARSRTAAVDATTPLFRDFSFSGLSLGQVPAVALIEGLPERFIRGVRIEDVSALGCSSGVACTMASEVSIGNLTVGTLEGPALDARSVLALEAFRIRCAHPNRQQPVLWLENVAGAFIHGCDMGDAADGFEWMHQEASRSVTLADNRVPAPPRPPGR
jgi:hypothetical protein